MAYVKTVWETGDVITAEKLNNMEDGIDDHDPIVLTGTWHDEGGGFYNIEFDISGAEMFEAMAAGKRIVLIYPYDESLVPVESIGYVTYIDREEEDGAYRYNAKDTVCAETFGMPSFSDGQAKYVVSYGSE